MAHARSTEALHDAKIYFNKPLGTHSLIAISLLRGHVVHVVCFSYTQDLLFIYEHRLGEPSRLRITQAWNVHAYIGSAAVYAVYSKAYTPKKVCMLGFLCIFR